MTAKKTTKTVAKKATKKPTVKKATVKRKRNEAMVLPPENDSLDGYLQTHKTELVELVLTRIKYALKKNLEMVEVFKFTGSSFVVTLRDEDFYENVVNIIEYYLATEKYELCGNAYKIKKSIEKKHGK